MRPQFADAYDRAAPFTLTSEERLFGLWQAIHYLVDAKIPGDVVECGVWRGGSAMMAALALRDRGEERDIWLYDTYEGMAAPSDRDRSWTGELAATMLAKQHRKTGANIWAFATLEEVQANMNSTDYPESRVHYVRGLVEQTIPAETPESVALLRLDTDWYESTLHELEHLWPKLQPGGVLILDDYGHWQGAREATDEFFADKPILLSRLDYSGRIAVKTST